MEFRQKVWDPKYSTERSIRCCKDGITLEKAVINKSVKGLEGGVWWRGYHAIRRMKYWRGLKNISRLEMIEVLNVEGRRIAKRYSRLIGREYDFDKEMGLL